MQKKYVIIGAGNGGQSLAADIVIHGTEISAIYDKNPKPINDIRKAGGIEVSGPVMQGFAPIAHPTDRLEDAMQQGNVFLVTIVGNFHPILAKEMAPYVRETDIILLIPGNSGSSLIFRKVLSENGVTKMPLIAETISMPYATRLLGPAHAGIKAKKLSLPMAALPARRNDELFAAINPIMPETILWSDALSVGMNNFNPCGHVPYYLYNIGKVESPNVIDADFHAWNTPTTDRIRDLYDAERIRVMTAIGLEPISYQDSNKMCYNNKHYVPIKQANIVSENAVQVPDRFIDEDVPLNMTLISEMGHQLGIPTPVTDLLIDTSNLIRQKDFRASGTTMEKLGLASLEKDYVREVIGKS